MLTMRKGLQTLEFSFEGEALTHFGGLFLIQRFCNSFTCGVGSSASSNPRPGGLSIARRT